MLAVVMIYWVSESQTSRRRRAKIRYRTTWKNWCIEAENSMQSRYNLSARMMRPWMWKYMVRVNSPIEKSAHSLYFKIFLHAGR